MKKTFKFYVFLKIGFVEYFFKVHPLDVGIKGTKER